MSVYIKLDPYNTAVLSYQNMNGSSKYRFITNFTVPKSFRRRGIAHRLLKHACDLADKELFNMFIYIIPSREMSTYAIMKMLKRHNFDSLNRHTMVRCYNRNPNLTELSEILEQYEME